MSAGVSLVDRAGFPQFRPESGVLRDVHKNTAAVIEETELNHSIDPVEAARGYGSLLKTITLGQF